VFDKKDGYGSGCRTESVGSSIVPGHHYLTGTPQLFRDRFLDFYRFSIGICSGFHFLALGLFQEQHRCAYAPTLFELATGGATTVQRNRVLRKMIMVAGLIIRVSAVQFCPSPVRTK